MSQASEFIILKMLKKEANPDKLDIKEAPKINGKTTYRFPDGSKMVYEGNDVYVEIEELK